VSTVVRDERAALVELRVMTIYFDEARCSVRRDLRQRRNLLDGFVHAFYRRQAQQSSAGAPMSDGCEEDLGDILGGCSLRARLAPGGLAAAQAFECAALGWVGSTG